MTVCPPDAAQKPPPPGGQTLIWTLLSSVLAPWPFGLVILILGTLTGWLRDPAAVGFLAIAVGQLTVAMFVVPLHALMRVINRTSLAAYISGGIAYWLALAALIAVGSGDQRFFYRVYRLNETSVQGAAALVLVGFVALVVFWALARPNRYPRKPVRVPARKRWRRRHISVMRRRRSLFALPPRRPSPWARRRPGSRGKPTT